MFESISWASDCLFNRAISNFHSDFLLSSKTIQFYFQQNLIKTGSLYVCLHLYAYISQFATRTTLLETDISVDMKLRGKVGTVIPHTSNELNCGKLNLRGWVFIHVKHRCNVSLPNIVCASIDSSRLVVSEADISFDTDCKGNKFEEKNYGGPSTCPNRVNKCILLCFENSLRTHLSSS